MRRATGHGAVDNGDSDELVADTMVKDGARSDGLGEDEVARVVARCVFTGSGVDVDDREDICAIDECGSADGDELGL